MDILDIITDYFGVGGLFNPELMEHDKVSNMVEMARAEITSLREQLEIAKKDGWISVDTALPDDCDEYAVWMLDTITQQEYFTTSHLNPAKTGFYVDYIDDDTPREQVTHWQPLPEPPKE